MKITLKSLSIAGIGWLIGNIFLAGFLGLFLFYETNFNNKKIIWNLPEYAYFPTWEETLKEMRAEGIKLPKNCDPIISESSSQLSQR